MWSLKQSQWKVKVISKVMSMEECDSSMTCNFKWLNDVKKIKSRIFFVVVKDTIKDSYAQICIFINFLSYPKIWNNSEG